ncbi:MAG: esterase [Chloroflexi bacterium HGW-Chloroflexi-3]|nr:MAG: esterase [Chloroflexi bacterium HGW-Chloroflexi-3]
MALIRLDHVPVTIKVNVPVHIILPDPGKIKNVPIRDRKVLYLLHGLSDDGSAWQRFSSIETYANAYGLLVIIPSAGRSFYVDQPNGQAYFTYLVEELPQYIHDVFHLSPRREDTFIAGNSMGGYGAFKAAFLRPDLYQAAASLSGVLSLAILNNPNDKRQEEFKYLFGDFSKLPGSEHDPASWLKNAIEQNKQLPELYIACGKQDDLYPLNVYFQQACLSAGLNVHYHEEDANHDWFFWDKQILSFLQQVLDPLPNK